jgi:hypothetical protein
MMKKDHAPILLLTVMATAFLMLSCATSYKTPLVDKKPVKKEAYGSPKDSALVYGSLWMNFDSDSLLGLVGVRKSYYANALQMLQLNPAKPAMVITPARKDNFFFTAPLPVGSSIRIFYFYEETKRSFSTELVGLQGQSPADRRLDKPGLCYMGSLVYTDRDYAEKKFGVTNSGGYEYKKEDFFNIGTDKEVDALKALLPKYRDTEWEPIIRDRIKELKK